MGLQKFTSEEEFRSCMNGLNGKPVFVQFSAEWCGPCQSIEGNMDDFSQQYADSMVFRYLDVDDYESIAGE